MGLRRTGLADHRPLSPLHARQNRASHLDGRHHRSRGGGSAALNRYVLHGRLRSRPATAGLPADATAAAFLSQPTSADNADAGDASRTRMATDMTPLQVGERMTQQQQRIHVAPHSSAEGCASQGGTKVCVSHDLRIGAELDRVAVRCVRVVSTRCLHALQTTTLGAGGFATRLIGCCRVRWCVGIRSDDMRRVPLVRVRAEARRECWCGGG